jgi:hypothetical protein
MSSRTTHSDLSRLLLDFAEKLKRLPEGYCVSDPSSLRLLTDSARILVEQDRRIDTLVVGLASMNTQAAREIIVAAQPKK